MNESVSLKNNSSNASEMAQNIHDQENQQCFRRLSFWNQACQCVFSVIPDAMLVKHLFSFMSVRDLCGLANVCKRWQSLLADKSLWTHVNLTPCLMSKTMEQTNTALNDLHHCMGSHTLVLRMCQLRVARVSLLTLLSPNAIRPLHHLVEIHLCRIQTVDDDIIDSLTSLSSNLRRLHISNTQNITDKALSLIGSRLLHLDTLSARTCFSITGTTLYTLPVSLRELALSGCKNIVGDNLHFLARLHSLHTLNLHGVCAPDDTLVAICKSCGSIQSLTLSSSNPFGGSSGITNLSLHAIGRNLTNLLDINLAGASLVSDYGIKSIALRCAKLKQINLGACTRITDESVALLVDRCPHLSHITLNDCDFISDESFKYLSVLKTLHHLDVHGCRSLTNASIQFLTQDFVALSFIDLSVCAQISADALQHLPQQRSSLRVLHY